MSKNLEKENLIFQALSWKPYHIDRDEDSEDSESQDNTDLPGYYTMDCYGKTLDGKDVYIKIMGYTPHFYIKIPEEYHSSCKSILRVCAFTYVIGSLTSILNVRNIWFLLRAVMFRR